MIETKDIIGVLTWARNINYGGVLQAVALRSAIERLGFQAELVHYEQNQADVSYGRLFGFTRHSRMPLLLGWVIDFVFRVLVDGYFFASVLRLKRSREFIKKHVKLSKEYYPDYPSLCRQTKYNTIVVGSDQVWNPRFFNDVPGYLLAEMPECVRKISYAASVAMPRIGKDIQYFKAALPKYAAVSVREKSSVEELEKNCGVPVKWVVDPTLLLSASEWTKLLSLPAICDDGYVACYWLSELEDVLPQVLSFAKANHVKVHVFSNIEAFRIRKLTPNAILRHLWVRIRLLVSPYVSFRKSADPRQFLSDLVASSAVVSDSFHALMFSTIFRKPVKIVVPAERMQMASRIDDFLEHINLQCVRVNSLPDAFMSLGASNCSAAAYVGLDRWIDESRTWLQAHIMGDHK